MKKLLKFFLYLVLFVGILFAIVYFGSSPIIKNIVADKLKKQNIAGIYKASFKNAYFNIFAMGISITDFELKPDSSKSAKALYKYQKQLVHVYVKRLNINNIDIIKFIQEKKISIQRIVLRNPKVDLYKNHHFVKALNKKKPTVVSDVKDVRLKDISIIGLSLNYYIDEDKKADLTIDRVDLRLEKPVIEISKISKPFDAISVDDIKLNIKNIKFNNNQLYKLSLKSAEYQHKSNTIVLNKVLIKPRFNKTKFANKHKYQTDRFDIDISTINIKGFNIVRFIKEKVIALQEVNISGLNMEVYRDKNFPFNLNKFPKLPQRAIRDIKQKIEIETISLQSSSIVYLEKAVGAKKAGKVEFKKVRAKISNFGNTNSWKNNKRLLVDAQTKIFGKGLLSVNLDFPLNSNTFYLKGHLAQTPMTIFNAISAPNAGIKIRKGNIDKLDFSASLNNKNSLGKMSFYYHGLDISILKKTKKTGQIKDSKLFNFLANSVFLPKSNPNKKGKFYESTISFERDKNKGLFAYLWKSVFSGLKDTMIKKNKKKKLKHKK